VETNLNKNLKKRCSKNPKKSLIPKRRYLKRIKLKIHHHKKNQFWESNNKQILKKNLFR
jgi:hypothetical protein